MELRNIYGDIIFALEGAKTTLELVYAAREAKKSLSGAVLRGAVLSDADLRGAVLRGAVLSDAVLSGAVLRGAVLRDADLSGAVLRDADLSGAVLRDAVLSGADLSGAVLRDAVLSGAVLSGAVLRDEQLDGVPLIPGIHRAVYEAASKPDALNMSSWHTCDTTHCRAGWVVALAGAGGKALEWAMGTPAAAAVIYMRSDPKLDRVPDFYASNDDALEDMKRLAELESATK
jgi:uncharacterized protein YjbI with pentapeptide repeats